MPITKTSLLLLGDHSRPYLRWSHWEGIFLKGYALTVRFILCKALLQGLVDEQTVIQFSPCSLRAVMYFNPSLNNLLSHVCLLSVSHSLGRKASAFSTFYINQSSHVIFLPFFFFWGCIFGQKVRKCFTSLSFNRFSNTLQELWSCGLQRPTGNQSSLSIQLAPATLNISDFRNI